MKSFKLSKALSNGQVATCFYVRDKEFPEYINVSFVIGKSIRQNKNWWNDKPGTKSIKSTGQCGLEGLMFALATVRQLQDDNNIIIEWSDEQRHSAYKYLKRYGFKEGCSKEYPGWSCLYWDKAWSSR